MPPNSLLPKQRALTSVESQSTYDSWADAMRFHISVDPKSARLLSDMKTWSNALNRGFTDDDVSVAADIKMSAIAKTALLNLVLGSIASYAPVISPKFIKNVATSLDDIWDRLRSFYGFRKSGARITEFSDFKLEPMESREALWERMYSFLEDNLLTKDGSVKHNSVQPVVDEEFSPTLLCVLVVNWLNTIHPSLPHTVRQKFPTQLRSDTIYSIRNEISDAIPSMLEEIEEKATISRMGRFTPSKFPRKPKFTKKKRCCLCEAAGRQADGHYLSLCPFLPHEDKRYISKSREITVEESDSDCEDDADERHAGTSHVRSAIASSRRIDIMPSPVIRVSVGEVDTSMLLDLGAEANLVTEEECHRIGAKILPTNQRALMADGQTSLKTTGETHFSVKFGHHIFKFSGLVVERLDTALIAGVPFLVEHDIYVRPSTRTAYISECCSFKYQDNKVLGAKVNRCNATVLRVSHQTCLLPGDHLSLPLPEDLCHEDVLALEPRPKSVPANSPKWVSYGLVPVQNGCIKVFNSSKDPVLISRHAQILQVRPTIEAIPDKAPPNLPTVSLPKPDDNPILSIKVDPSGILTESERNQFHKLHRKFNTLFSPGIGCYNGHSGHYEHIINMSGALPPQRRGRIPMYNRHNLDSLQMKYDELLAEGVFCRPEDVDISVTHSNLTFLVKKSSGGNRLVTSFGEVAEYALVPPSVTSNVEDVLRQVGQWRYLIKTDLKSAYYQIPLAKESMRFVGVNTPYKGTYIYQRSVMGLPGSEAALEEVLSRILGDLVQGGGVIKLVDDLYIGAESVNELLNLWNSVLERLCMNGLKLSPDKTVCCPTSTMILGWLWESGSIRPTSHRLNALMICEPPKTVKGLRSFIGCYKYMSRSLPFYADILHPLEEACSSLNSSNKLAWSDQLVSAFNKAKDHLKEAQPVILPKHSDQLHIVTDAAVRCAGIASALYVVRGKKPQLAGFFNAKRRGSQASWLPCEVEALSIGVSIKHFSPYILQSNHQTRIMTDSKPCVQAYKKLQRGEFSTSPRVTTFLSIVSRFRVEVIHIPGKDNVFADFASRNPINCSGACQVCTFVDKLEACVVNQLQVSDILSGCSQIPYTSRNSWLQIQQSCPELMKVREYLKEGISPSGKKKGITDILRYMNCASLSTSPNDGMVIVKRSDPFQKSTQRIVIPRKVAHGILTALHLELNHPSTHQLEQVFSRAFFMLDMHSVASQVVDGCHPCAALKHIPSSFKKQSTSEYIDMIGSSMTADVLRDNGQFIIILNFTIFIVGI